MAKKPRGKDLDARLMEILDDMKKLGFKVAPISRSTVQRRLAIKSRSTLLLNGRAQLIDTARKFQLHEAGLDKNEKKRRNTPDEQILNLKTEIDELKKQRDHLMEKFASIINGLQAKGYDAEKLMLPLRPNYRGNKNKRG